jgi:hypothetical protein
MESGMAQKKQVGVRVPDATRAFLKRRAAASGLTEAAMIRRALETFRDVYESLGEDWWEIDRRANSSEQAAGRIVGALAKLALDQERRPKK